MSDTLRERISQRLLPYVEQPGQYIGGEINQLVRDGDWEKADVRLAIAFPDAYTVGLSHLGCQILYWIANHLPGVCAERVYAPMPDAEAVMRREGLPLFTWDSRQPVASADLLAVSLQYEMGFTNLLNILDLAGIPLWSRQRDDTHPLVIAGGPQADNPEPVADFLDLVVIGDGEESLPAILNLYMEMKAGGMRRRDMIAEMAKRFPWAYAPGLYDARYHPDGTLDRLTPRLPDLPTEITRCRVKRLEDAPLPLRPLVPYVQLVHDRMSVEIMRGCPQACRFCHEGYTKRPVRARSVERILEVAESQYWATGHSELGLLSLSTGDYPHLRELAERINERFAPRHVNISVPSLRVDEMLRDVPWLTNSVRKGGLTVAVEAARDRLRASIRKKVTDGDLMDGVLEAYKAGWQRVKCYFMVGFPGETEDDVRAICDLSAELSLLRRRIGKPPGRVTASVGWLVPKPHTPLQWAAQPTAEYFEWARQLLVETCRSRRLRSVAVKTHDVQRSVMEAVLSRGDRRLAPVIERAFREGARFDAWDEYFRMDPWQRAFESCGLDPAWYAHRPRPPSERLPWDHIRAGSKRDFLWWQYEDALARNRD